MMTQSDTLPKPVMRRLIWPLRWTWIGLLSERLTRAFWPLLALILLGLSLLMFGFQDQAPLELVWGAIVVFALGVLGTLVWGIRQFRWPRRVEALERLDATLKGHPIATLGDEQAIGAGDSGSEALWTAHLARMEKRLEGVKPAQPDLKLSSRDPYALRYVALIAFVMALIFGSLWRVSSVTALTPGAGGLAEGPSWEGWIEPPVHTGLPSLYLADQSQSRIEIVHGSRVTIRLYGEIGALTVAETISARIGELPPASDSVQSFDAIQDGTLEIAGPGGRSWQIIIDPDTPPEIEFDGPLELGARGEMRQPFYARDDYEVISGQATIMLDLNSVERRYGLVVDPDPRDQVVLDLPMTITGDRSAFAETLIEDLSDHPWAGLPVTMTLTARDALDQEGQSPPQMMILPPRRFFDPLASAIVEQRRDLLWSRENAKRVSQLLRAVSHRPEEVFRDSSTYLMLRAAIRELESEISDGPLNAEAQERISQTLWEIALLIEEGDLSDALEQLRRAQDRIAEAMRDGATDEEIAELMDELRQAMENYMRQLAQEGGQNQQQAQDQPPGETISQAELEAMLQQLQELLEQGRMAEAQELLDQLRQMMENMQVARGQQGQGQPSPGQQAMEGLAETLREQQGLSDDSFQSLQDQFRPGGEGDGQQSQQGQGPGEPGEGQSGGGQLGEGQGQNPNGRNGPGQGMEPGQGQMLADRQRALQQELNRQLRNLPGAGTAEGDAARDALGRAERSMEGAEEALRQEDFAGALDDQADAMEALREGMRELGEMMAQENQGGGRNGEAVTQSDPNGRDPLGREAGDIGRVGTDEDLLQGEDAYRRARELVDEIRKRSGERARPEAERNYLKRLLDRF